MHSNDIGLLCKNNSQDVSKYRIYPLYLGNGGQCPPSPRQEWVKRYSALESPSPMADPTAAQPWAAVGSIDRDRLKQR